METISAGLEQDGGAGGVAAATLGRFGGCEVNRVADWSVRGGGRGGVGFKASGPRRRRGQLWVNAGGGEVEVHLGREGGRRRG